MITDSYRSLFQIAYWPLRNQPRESVPEWGAAILVALLPALNGLSVALALAALGHETSEGQVFAWIGIPALSAMALNYVALIRNRRWVDVVASELPTRAKATALAYLLFSGVAVVLAVAAAAATAPS